MDCGVHHPHDLLLIAILIDDNSACFVCLDLSSSLMPSDGLRNCHNLRVNPSIMSIVGIQIIKVVSPSGFSRQSSQCIRFVIGSLCLCLISATSLLVSLLLRLFRLIRHLLRILRKINIAIYCVTPLHRHRDSENGQFCANKWYRKRKMAMQVPTQNRIANARKRKDSHTSTYHCHDQNLQIWDNPLFSVRDNSTDIPSHTD